jgi:PII-like signaling protein
MDATASSILKIFASTTDKIGSKLLYEFVVHKAKEEGLSGVTVYRGIMGYGLSSKISSSKFWELTEKLPVKIEIIDSTLKLEIFCKKIEKDLMNMEKGCLVIIEPVKVVLQKKGK